MAPARAPIAQVARADLVLATNSVAVRPGGGEGRAFGDAMAAGRSRKTRVGRVGQPGRLGLELRGAERNGPARRGAAASAWTAGSSALRSSETTQATAPAARPCRGQRALDQIDELPGRRAPLAADADAPEPADAAPGVAPTPASSALGHQRPRRRRGRGERAPPAVSQRPSPASTERHRLAGEQRGHRCLGGRRIARPPAGRRLVERQPEADVAGGGDRGLAALRPGDRPRQVVGAVMAAEQGHGELPSRRPRPPAARSVLSASNGASTRIRMPAAQMPTIGRRAQRGRAAGSRDRRRRAHRPADPRAARASVHPGNAAGYGGRRRAPPGPSSDDRWTSGHGWSPGRTRINAK